MHSASSTCGMLRCATIQQSMGVQFTPRASYRWSVVGAGWDANGMSVVCGLVCGLVRWVRVRGEVWGGVWGGVQVVSGWWWARVGMDMECV